MSRGEVESLLSFSTKQPRVRREWRTLSDYDHFLYVEAIKLMRNTSYSAGATTFGKSYRTYDYLLFKHALSTVHPCADQGHLPEIVLSYHRAFLLEFEMSLISIVEVIDSRNSTSLEALPYWDFFIDEFEGPGLFESSLWNFFGSPYGNPNDNYSIHDPLFQTVIPSTLSTYDLNPGFLSKYIEDPIGIGEQGSELHNDHGLWRSPHNSNPSKAISRNPGWAFSAPLEKDFLKKQSSRDCINDSGSYMDFARCVSGDGTATKDVYFGPHFAVHIAMGTFNDDGYSGVAWAPTRFIILSTGFIFFVMIVYNFSTKIAKNIPGLLIPEDLKKAKHKQYKINPQKLLKCSILTFLWLILISLLFALICEQFKFFTGIQGWQANHAIYEFLGFYFPDLKLWRQHIHQENLILGSSFLVTILKYIVGNPFQFQESDYWSNAFSPNENFFFPVHGFYDLMHLQWQQKHARELILRDNASTAPSWDILKTEIYKKSDESLCEGVSWNSVISREFCFTSVDIGIHINATQNEQRSGDFARDPNQPCLTHNQLLSLFSNYDQSGNLIHLLDNSYTYDRISERYTWHSTESMETCPVFTVECKELEIEGETRCIENFIPVLESQDQRENVLFHQVSDEFCINFSTLAKPNPPIKRCRCKDALYKKLTLDERKQLEAARLAIPTILIFMTIGLMLLVIFRI